MPDKIDMLLVGQGLAGSLLAWELHRRGKKFIVINDTGPAAASKVAAGMLNPLAGKRLALYPETEALLATATDTYTRLEAHFGKTFFHALPIYRYFQDEKEAERFQERKRDPDFASYIGDHIYSSTDAELQPGLQGFCTLLGGWTDVPALVESMADWLKSKGTLIEAPFEHASLDVGSESIKWGEIEARYVVFCEGWRVIRNPWFSHLPWDPVKGEILKIQAKGKLPDAILNRGKWLVPAACGTYRGGATYDRQSLDASPTESGQAEILAGLHQLVTPDTLEVIGYLAGIRPGTRTQHPFLGRHPEHPSLAIFNGFGSKGTLLIPAMAQKFCDYMFEEKHLDKHIDMSLRWEK